MSEKKEIKDETLSAVTGGNTKEASFAAQGRATAGGRNGGAASAAQQVGVLFGKGSMAAANAEAAQRAISHYSKGAQSGQCEPEEIENSAPQQFTCSDPTNRGKKPECANCSVGIR